MDEQELLNELTRGLQNPEFLTVGEIRDYYSNYEILSMMRRYWDKIEELGKEVIKHRKDQDRAFQEVQSNSANILKTLLVGIDIGEKAGKSTMIVPESTFSQPIGE